MKNKILPAILAFLCLSFLLPVSGAQSTNNESDCVIVLHGLGRSHYAMQEIEEALKDQNYLVWNQSYPSTQGDIQSLAPNAILPGIEFCKSNGATSLHLVTHSLGGILTRYFFQDTTLKAINTELGSLELNRVVMLAPPNQGSEIAELLNDYSWVEMIMGPAILQLGDESSALLKELQPIAAEIGIIAGAKSSDPWFQSVFDGVNDGKVSVESTQLPEMQDFLVVDAGHTFIMKDENVIEQILHFLENGNFLHP